MFGRKKRIKQEKAILDEVNNLLVDDTVKPEERKVLLTAKKMLEKDEYLPRVTKVVTDELRPLALKSQLSKNVGKLYLNLIDAGSRDTGWSGIAFGNLHF